MMRNKPMLAYPASAKPIKYGIEDAPIFIQPKLDGVRCVIQADKIDYLTKCLIRTCYISLNLYHPHISPFFHIVALIGFILVTSNFCLY